jgi:hypothetical protein
LEEIPEVAIEVSEHSDRAVGLLLRLANKDDAPALVQVIVAPEVIGIQEQEHASSGLISDSRSLLVADRSGEKQA